MAKIADEDIVTSDWNTFQVLYHSVLVVYGIPFNLFVALVLAFTRQLHNSRNLLWLAVALCNLAVLLVVSFEYLAIYLESRLACRLVATLLGKPYALVLANLLLVTCERIAYIKSPLLHRKHSIGIAFMGAQFICVKLAVVFLAPTFMVMFMPYVCRVQLETFQFVTGAIFMLATLYILATIFLYHEIKDAQNGPRREIILSDNVLSSIFSLLPEQAMEEQTTTANFQLVNTPLTNRFGSRRIRQLEWNVTVIALTNSIPLISTMILTYLALFSRTLCSLVDADCDMNFEVYFRELYLLHVSCNLVCYVTRSGEFQSAALKWFRFFQTEPNAGNSN